MKSYRPEKRVSRVRGWTGAALSNTSEMLEIFCNEEISRFDCLTLKLQKKSEKKRNLERSHLN